MGTFHQGKSELHGITVVVDTHGPEIYVGRCDDVVDGKVILLEGDRHVEGEVSKQSWLDKAAMYGVWKSFDRTVIPRDQVASIRRLGEV